jgi:hypothetical protein
VGREPNAHRTEVSDDLGSAFVEANVQGSLAAPAGGGREEPAQRRLGGSRCTGNKDVAAAVVPTSQHVVEARKPSRDPFIGDVVLKLHRATIGQLQAFLRERDWEVVARKARAPELLDAKTAEGRSVHHLMLENDHAIDHELQEAVALVCIAPTNLLRNDARQPRLREPVTDAIELSALRHRVVE